MRKASYFFNGTTTPQTFNPIPGITTYNFVVIGGGGGGYYNTNINTGGSGGVVQATYHNVTELIQLVIGGGGGGSSIMDDDISYGSGGGGLTQVFSTQVNIIAGGGGGGGAGVGGIACSNNGPAGGDGFQGAGAYGQGGRADGTGGNLIIIDLSYESGGSFNSTGNGGNGVNGGDLGEDTFFGGGGGGAGINGITGQGGRLVQPNFNNGGINGGGSGGKSISSCGGGAGYGGGGGGFLGGAGSSIVLFAGMNVSYAPAPYNDLPYGTGVRGKRGIEGYVEITWDTSIISNICFPAGTPIQTDQGIIPIEQIQTSVHTLQKQPIQYITQTCTLDKYLIAFSPHTLGKNIPRQRTIMSKDHKILYNNQLVPAERFLDVSSAVKKVAYHGETLYNVLLNKYQLIDVNGLQCETLHPENTIARLYKSNFNETYKQQLKKEHISNVNSAYKSLTSRWNSSM